MPDRPRAAAAALAWAACACASSPTVSRAYFGEPSERLRRSERVAPDEIGVYRANGPADPAPLVERIVWLSTKYKGESQRREAIDLVFAEASRHHANVLLDWEELRETVTPVPWGTAHAPRTGDGSYRVRWHGDSRNDRHAGIAAGFVAALALAAAVRVSGAPFERGTIRACAARLHEPGAP